MRASERASERERERERGGGSPSESRLDSAVPTRCRRSIGAEEDCPPERFCGGELAPASFFPCGSERGRGARGGFPAKRR